MRTQQTAARVFRVGVLDPDPAAFAAQWDEFVAELARRGYVEGKNLVFERRFGEELRPAGVDKLAAELVALQPDVLYAAHGTLSALALKRATRDDSDRLLQLGRPGRHRAGREPVASGRQCHRQLDLDLRALSQERGVPEGGRRQAGPGRRPAAARGPFAALVSADGRGDRRRGAPARHGLRVRRRGLDGRRRARGGARGTRRRRRGDLRRHHAAVPAVPRADRGLARRSIGCLRSATRSGASCCSTCTTSATSRASRPSTSTRSCAARSRPTFRSSRCRRSSWWSTAGRPTRSG